MNATTDMFPLYKDVLQVIIRYLTLSELNASVQLSKQWLESVRCSKSIGLITLCKQPEEILLHNRTVIARHIAHCPYIDQAIRRTPSLLSQIVTIFPNLTSLMLRPYPLPPEALTHDGLVLPNLINIFQITIGVEHVNRLLPGISRLSHLTLLDLHVQLTSEQQVNLMDFSILINRLPKLQKFRLDFDADQLRGDSTFDASFVQFLRHSTTLTELDFNSRISGEFLTPAFHQLVDNACPLIQSGSLKNVCLPNAMLESSLLRELVKIPTLTKLSPDHWRATETDMQHLSLLPNLTHLDLKSEQTVGGALTTAGIVVGCKSCPQLTELRVDHFELTTEELNTCLANLPKLTALKITRCHSMKRLTPILDHGLPLRMQALTIINCDFLLEDATCVLSLRELRQLTLAMAFIGTMPLGIHSQFDRKSPMCAFPKLKYSYVMRGYG